MSPKIKLEENTASIGSSELFENVSIINQPDQPKAKVIPPNLITRNEYGLVEDNSLNYVFNDDGTINWRKMVKVEHLVPNRQKTQEADVSKLQDKDLLILLGGIKELAQIRGYTSVEYKVVAASENYFATSCRITWLPNYETGGKEVIFESLEKYSIIITPHKFSQELHFLKKYGLFNVSFQLFKNNSIGISCLKKWKQDCFEWCKDEYDEKFQRFADQKYLDTWEKEFGNSLLVLNGPETGLAIWNINNFKLNFNHHTFFANGRKVIFYHFHNFKSVRNNIVLNGFYNYKVNNNKTLNIIYKNYWTNLNLYKNMYNLNIDNSIRFKKLNILSILLNECSFYLVYFDKIYPINLKYIPKIIRKLFTKIYG